MSQRFIRLAETDRARVRIVIDGQMVAALAGDTLMVAMLNNVRHLRESEFGDGKRSGFCLMGACQDCWVWTQEGERLRACTTVVEEGLHIVTQQPEATWPNLA
ncbi:MAG: (2Fe-2S)-binding protein [Burkholderiaceae bacterium]|nr:(2Fe-2S)-binding protein [Burkholderiaceae bacterium]